MRQKIIMFIEFAVAILFLGLGFTIAFPFLLENVFFCFMGIILFIMAAHKLDEVLGNGKFNMQATTVKNQDDSENKENGTSD